jgi:arabinofuranosyltransferase
MVFSKRQVLPAVASLAALLLAASRSWICDDAYICFRYADNLVKGGGLVFNQGERVEGFTNLSWTLFSALGLYLGIPLERWVQLGGLLAFAGTLILLSQRTPDRPALSLGKSSLPVAVLVAGSMVHFLDFATGGLETSAFTFLVLASYRALFPLSGHAPSPRRGALGGLGLALGCLTRPDGMIFTAILLLALLALRRGRAFLAAAMGFSALWVPATLWRVHYYGDFFPNTYYAKSAYLAWWSQGFAYVQLFAVRYWPLLLALPLSVYVVGKKPTRDRRDATLVGVEACLVAGYTLYVARVGGDFMFGRLLIPIVPFLLLLFERGFQALFAHRRGSGLAFLAATLAMNLFSPAPSESHARGILDEREFYGSEKAAWATDMDRKGEILRGFLQGTPARVCFFGSEARLIFRSEVASAIECETGLTDRWIARQPLAARGRVGHEKHAPLDYILEERPVNFLFKLPWGPPLLGLDRAIPAVPIRFGSVEGRVVTWDGPLMATLRARGVAMPDLPAQLDDYLKRLPSMPPAEARRSFAGLRRLYFNHTRDPAREAAFRSILEAAPAGDGASPDSGSGKDDQSTPTR